VIEAEIHLLAELAHVGAELGGELSHAELGGEAAAQPTTPAARRRWINKPDDDTPTPPH
jgi:hypothetical protein